MVNARPNTYKAGIETATSRNPTADQKVDLFQTTNATDDQHRRAYEEHRAGIVVAKNGDQYTVRIDATGENVTVAKERILGKGPQGTYTVGERVSNGTIVRTEMNGKYEVIMDTGERQLMELPEKQGQATDPEVGETVRIVTNGEANLENRAILNTTPGRYDGAVRTLTASDGQPLGMPRDSAKGTEWFRNDDLMETVNSNAVHQVLDRRQVEGQNQHWRTEEGNAALAMGTLSEEKDATISSTLQYATPPANLTHRPSHMFANEEVASE